MFHLILDKLFDAASKIDFSRPSLKNLTTQMLSEIN